MTTSALFGEISSWLLARALTDADLDETVAGLGRRLVRGGVPVARINFGSMLLHPVLGALDVTWDALSDTCRSQAAPRIAAKTPEFQNAPFFQMVKHNVPFARHRLADPKERAKYPVFETLAAMGVTDYVALFESYGRKTPLTWADLPAGVEGAVASFSTKRSSGFTEAEVENLRSLSAPFALAMKTSSERSLAKALLETYLGKASGARVLDGLVDRGDGWVIDCCLWYSDLRRSTTMASELDIDRYFATINDYFDCTADAVLDHGGEVLKLIGDAVMAIFPFEEGRGPARDLCQVAAATARDALHRLADKNRTRAEQGLAEIEFGIGLHAGKVMYGNVGTARRLDLTVTGAAANEVARLEGLCKRLAVPVIASEEFRAIYGGELVPLGRQDVVGIDEGLFVFTLPDFGNTP
ncbi:MAG: adenylate/guanylate cyclase domain-containing protein [Pseudomonadota bacterium]